MNQNTFSNLSLSEEIEAAVQKMGFTQMTEIQAQAIPVIRTGADVLARSQTGTGKTIAFSIPAIECINAQEVSPQVLILSPTRELASQCGDEIRKLSKKLPHIKTVDLLGGGSYREQLQKLKSANLVIGTPGRLIDHIKRGTLNLTKLKMLVLDEADEMLNMGFREDIEYILQDTPQERQIVLFSATVPQEIVSIAKKFQKKPVKIDINSNQITIENIKQLYVNVPQTQKVEALTLLFHYYQPTRCIIFCNTKAMVDKLNEQLNIDGFSVESLHGDMKQLQRTTVMNKFKSGCINILIATDVVARGIDVNNVDYVINFDIPKEKDYYVHRIGRTGRAGRNGTSITFCCSKAQLAHIRRLEMQTKSVLTQIFLPTAKEIQQANQSRNLTTVQKALAVEPEQHQLEMAEVLLNQGYSPEYIVGALLGLCFKQSTQSLPKVIDKRGISTTPDSQKSAPKIRTNSSQWTEVVVDIGSSSRAKANHIVGAITERTGISSRSIGKIHTRKDYSTVELLKDQVDQILIAMENCRICGKPVSMTLLQAPKPRNDFHKRGTTARSNKKDKQSRPYKKYGHKDA